MPQRKNDMQIEPIVSQITLERMTNNMKFVLNQQPSRDDAGYYLAFGISLPMRSPQRTARSTGFSNLADDDPCADRSTASSRRCTSTALRAVIRMSRH